VSTPDASLPKRPKGGMASLAADLTSRAGSLAHRSTDERLVPVVSAPGPAVDPKSAPTSSDVARRRPKPVVRELPQPQVSDISRPERPAPVARLPRPLAGPEGRLEASGETVVKWTLELAPQLIMALNVW